MLSANEVALRLITKAPAVWRFLSEVPHLNRWVNAFLIDYLTNTTKARPHPFSLWGQKDRSADYVSWTGLVDRTFTGRHLPPLAEAEGKSLPTSEEMKTLFLRSGQMTPCPKNSALFCFFAQWFTDSFLRTDPDDVRKNTSNHEIDLCQIYGLSPSDTNLLRENSGGLLKSQNLASGEYPPFLFDDQGAKVRNEFKNLSYIDAGTGTYKRSEILKDFNTPERRKFLFASGLERGNSTIFYCALNTIFLREHNRIARRLHQENPDWDDDRLFETARNINIVCLLQIVVRDYINHLSPTAFKLFPDIGFAERKRWYRTNRIAAEFNLLYRWHPLVPTTLDYEGETLPDALFRCNNEFLIGRGVEKVIDAAATQRAGRIQLGNTASFLVEADLAALAKSRAWRLKPYNDYRECFGLPRVASFEELTGEKQTAARLRELYGEVDRVDLMVGLLAEARKPDVVLGDLMTLMVGVDAFSQALTNPLLSQNVYGAETFSPYGLAVIEETTTLADVVRRNCAVGEYSASLAYGVPVVRDPPGQFGPRPLKTAYDALDFFLRGWERFFRNRRSRHHSTVFRINLLQPLVVVLDQRAISALFADRDLIQDYGFNSAVPPRPLVGDVTPSIFEAGRLHDAPKRFYSNLLRWRSSTFPTTFAQTFGTFAGRWVETRSFSWSDEIETFAAVFVFRWLLGASPDPADVRLVYGNIFLHRFVFLERLIPWSTYSRSLPAYARILDAIKAAPDFPKLMELAAKEGIEDEDYLAKQLAFLAGMNSFLGIQNLLKSLVGELSVHRDTLPKAPTPDDLDRFIRETLRLHPPVFMIFGRATRDRTIASDTGIFQLRQGELVMGVIPHAQTDPAVVPRAAEFDPDRFRDRAASDHLIWPRGLHDGPAPPEGRTCPGKDAAVTVAHAFCTALLSGYEWKLKSEPVWDRKRYSLNVAAPQGPLDVEWFIRGTGADARHPPPVGKLEEA